MIGPASLESLYHTAYSKSQYIAKTSRSTAVSASAGTAVADRICISREGSLQQTAAKACAAAGEIPSASPQRLSALREQIRTGAYHVSSADIAASMLSRSFSKEEVAEA